MKYWEDKHRTLYNGNCRSMSELADNSIQCCVTSPPYWGLRKYAGEQDSIWGGNPECSHEWGDKIPPPNSKSGKHQGILGGVNEAQDSVRFEGNLGCWCSLCGAWRGSYGLEPSPQMYVQHTVEILREIRRVLRKDGVVFWNVDDSYNGSGGDHKPEGKNDSGFQGKLYRGTQSRNVSNLKPKDLCLIPFRVAIAAQEPYYTGRIKKEQDRVWLASMIDAEGCLFIHKRPVGQAAGDGYLRKHDTYGAGLEVANTHKSIVEKCLKITGIGSICMVERETKNKMRNLPLYRWNVRSNECRQIIKEVYPHLVGKKHEARLLLSCPSSGPEAEKAHISLMALHNGKEACIDFPEPESMYEPGWYVRSVIIWSKKNPMPESVTDRPTGSHEYILMLTKSAKYYWDMEAVREKYTDLLNRWGGNDVRNSSHKYIDTFENGEENGGIGAIGKTSMLRAGALTRPDENGRNLRSVWEVPTHGYSGAHFATYPEKLVEICVKAATPEVGCCSKCGTPWERIVEKFPTKHDGLTFNKAKNDAQDNTNRLALVRQHIRELGVESVPSPKTLGWQPGCKCLDADKVPSIVVDPFCGSGTTLQVSAELGRNAVGYEISEDYCRLIVERNNQSCLL